MATEFHTVAYGRRCESSIPLPELVAAERGRVDFTLDVTREPLERPARWTERIGNDHETWLTYAGDGETSWFWFEGKVIYRCRHSRSGAIHVVAEPMLDVPLSTLRHLFIDEVLPALLAMTADCCVFHGAAVVFPAGAVLMVGDSGMGKSTLAASFGLSGFPVLADDCVVVDAEGERFVAAPSYPSVRLWSPSATELLGSTATGTVMAHYTPKRRYAEGMHFAKNAEQVLGIVRLENAPDDEPSLLALVPLAGHAASAVLLKSMKTTSRGRRKAKMFERITNLAREVPVASMTLPDDLDRVAEARALISSWLSR